MGEKTIFDAKDLDKLMSSMDIGSLTSKIKGIDLEPLKNMQGMLQDQLKILKPKTQKNVKIDDRDITVGLTGDSRVVVNFVTEEDAEAFYDKFGDFSTKKTTWLRKLINKIKI